MASAGYRPQHEKSRVDRLAQSFAQTRLGGWLFITVFPAIDKRLMPLTGGRLKVAIGQPILLLHTRGAKSGQPRTSPLLYTRADDGWVVVASKAGAERHPAWYHNAKAHPDEVEVEIGGRRIPARARDADGEEREQLWRLVNDNYTGYQTYQQRAGGRQIPVVVLAPRNEAPTDGQTNPAASGPEERVMATEAIEAQRRTVARAAATAAERYGERMAVRRREGGEWRELTFGQVGAIVDELALGLCALGLERGDRACILANTRPEWTFASLAISRAGGVVVPIYPTNSPEECEWVAGNSEARLVICENAGQAAKIAAVRERLGALEHVIAIDPDGADADRSLDDLSAAGRDGDREELERRCEGVAPEDPYTIIYTSGTTGPPKGVVLSHGNCASVGVMVEELGFVTEDDLSYLYLPLAHAFALTVQLASFDVGTGIVYFGGDAKQIVPELQQTQPTYFPSVPRIFEKIYAQATSMAPDQEQLRKAVEIGVEVRRRKRRGEPLSDGLQRAFDQADQALFSGVRALFGGSVRQAVSGAAPIAAEILEFFYACGVPVLEGWGMSETTAVGCVNTLEHIKFGTVGRPMPGVEVKIADDGEILIAGPNVFREYWRNPDATRETFADERWLKTGDLGSLDEDGFLSITGRKKDIIITAGGKNLTPANLENDLKQSRYISQAVMYGDRRPYPVALITLDPEEIAPWAKEHGLPTEIPELVKRDEVRQLIQDELDRANSKYAQVEQIKRFVLLDHDLSQEEGELTPTLKLKRNVVYDRYADLFAELYG